jgi:hypothetical protein
VNLSKNFLALYFPGRKKIKFASLIAFPFVDGLKIFSKKFHEKLYTKCTPIEDENI